MKWTKIIKLNGGHNTKKYPLDIMDKGYFLILLTRKQVMTYTHKVIEKKAEFHI